MEKDIRYDVIKLLNECSNTSFNVLGHSYRINDNYVITQRYSVFVKYNYYTNNENVNYTCTYTYEEYYDILQKELRKQKIQKIKKIIGK